MEQYLTLGKYSQSTWSPPTEYCFFSIRRMSWKMANHLIGQTLMILSGWRCSHRMNVQSEWSFASRLEKLMILKILLLWNMSHLQPSHWPHKHHSAQHGSIRSISPPPTHGAVHGGRVTPPPAEVGAVMQSQRWDGASVQSSQSDFHLQIHVSFLLKSCVSSRHC